MSADPTPTSRAAEVCPDCGHTHTLDGCTGDPTPSDLWAGVSVSGCDCDYDKATPAPTEDPAPSQDTLRAAANAWDEAVQAIAQSLDSGESFATALAQTASHNPYRAALAATTPEAGQDGDPA